jgi:hypothetical protein
MFYRLLGMVVWKGGKWLLRRRYPTYVPLPMLVGALFAILAGVVLLVTRRNSD